MIQYMSAVLYNQNLAMQQEFKSEFFQIHLIKPQSESFSASQSLIGPIRV